MIALLCLLAPAAAPPTWKPGEYAAFKKVERGLDRNEGDIAGLDRMLAVRLALYGRGSWQATDSASRLNYIRKSQSLNEEGQAAKELFERLYTGAVAALGAREHGKALKLATAAVRVAEDLHGEVSYPVSMARSAQTHAALRAGVPVHELGPLADAYLSVSRRVRGARHPDHVTDEEALVKELFKIDSARWAADILKAAFDGLPPEEKAGVRGVVMLTNLAAALDGAGDSDAGMPYARRALASIHLIHPRSLRAAFLNNMGVMFRKGGDYEAAVKCYDEALAIKRSLPPRQAARELPMMMRNLGVLAAKLGDKAKARACYEEGLAAHESVWGPVGGAYGMLLSSLSYSLGPEQGVERLAAAMRGVKSCGDDEATVGVTLVSLIDALYDMGDFHRAEAVARRLVNIRRRTQGPRSLVTIAAIVKLGSVLRKRGVLREARLHFEEARRLAATTPGLPADLRRSIHQALGNWHLEAGDLPRACAVMRRAAAISLDHAERAATVLGMEGRLLLVGTSRTSLAQALTTSRLAGAPDARPYELVLAFKGLVTAREREDALARDDPAVASLLADLRDARHRLTKLPPAGKAFREEEQRKESLEERLARGVGSRAGGRPTPEAVRQALPPGAVLIDFIEYRAESPPVASRQRKWAKEDRLAAFVSHKAGGVVRVELGPSEPIASLVASWRESVDSLAEAKDADELRRLVWLPLERHIGDARLVLVAPDGPICDLPLAALPGREKGRYLIEERAFGTLTSARQLLDTPTSHKAEGMIVLGGARHGAGKAGGWADLPGTELEARRLAAGGTLLSGEKASREELLYALSIKRPRRLHLATHGYFDPTGEAIRTPFLRCGLALAGANADVSGRMTGEEVRGLDLRGCEMVTLSACETGRGAARYGEGLLSLRQAFHLAGARAVVASQWSVSDAATSVLMERMYAAMDGKTSKWEALRAAQLFVLNNPEAVLRRAEELRRAAGEGAALRGVGKSGEKVTPAAKGARSHPAWWAAFTLSGDGR